MASHQATHPFHLVEPSPWAAMGAIAAGLLAGGLILFMHGVTDAVLGIGVAFMLYTMFVWWRGVVQEAESGKFHTSVVQLGLRYGMALFIASEVMFFFAWFWAFFDASIYPNVLHNTNYPFAGVWPPAGEILDGKHEELKIFHPFQIPFVNTIVLLSSGVTVTWAHHGLRAGDRQTLIRGLWLTVLLGATFTGLQAWEYMHAGFHYTGGVYGTTFFMATGFHGAHVIIGTIFLSVCLVRSYLGHFKPDHHFGFEAAAWYWHFVDVVWLFLFTFVYWWSSAGAPESMFE